MSVPVLRADGAHFAVIAPAGFRILAVLDTATRILQQDLLITCGTEDHAPEDPHSRGEAYDVRVRGIPPTVLVKLVLLLTQTLGPRFTVLLETPVPLIDPVLSAIQTINVHATGPHLHIQQKKGTVYPPPDRTVDA